MSPRPARWRPSPDDPRGLLLPVTAASCCWAARIERAAALVPPVGHPTSHHVTGHKRKPADRNKSGRPRARTTQVTHCMRAPTGWRRCSRADGNGRLPGKKSTPGRPQAVVHRRIPKLPREEGLIVQTRSALPCQAPCRLAAPVPGASALRPARQLPSAAHRWQGTTGGQAPRPPARGNPPKGLDIGPPTNKLLPSPLEGFIVGPELWLPAA